MATRYKSITRYVRTKLTQRRTTAQLNEVLRDRHLARDIGLPYQRPEPRRMDQW